MKHHQTLRRGLGALLSLLLCLTLLPTAALAADNYGFYINGESVTDQNIHDYAALGVTATDSSKAYSIDYDMKTQTLTLTNVTITGASKYLWRQGVLSCGTAVQTIKLAGRNVIQCTEITDLPSSSGSNPSIAAIYTSGKLTIEGNSRSDSLEITMPALTNDTSTHMRGIYAYKASLTIQNCSLDVVCAGETKSSPSVTNAIYTDLGNITIENASVNAVIGKERDNGAVTALYGGTAIYANGGTLSITNSDITAGAYSSRTTNAHKYTALEGNRIKLDGCTLALTVQATDAANAARAIHTNYYIGSITLTNCTGALTGSDYGIHIESNSGSSLTNKATLEISGSDLIIHGKDNAIGTTGAAPTFTCVTVKRGADADSAEPVSDLSTVQAEDWQKPYLTTAASHSYADTANCTDDDGIRCETCGYELIAHQSEHKWSKWQQDTTTHTSKCQNPGCSIIKTESCTGGTATCQAQAVCEVCGGSYGPIGEHTFTAETVGAEYLKSSATCQKKAVYYKSCSVCGQSSEGAAYEATFESGDVDPSNHTGILGGWQTDADKHWKAYSCCGARSEEAAHSYTDASDTDCNICGYTRSIYTVTAHGLYGETMGITPGETYTERCAAGQTVGLQIGKRDGYTLDKANPLTLVGITKSALSWQAEEYEVTTRGIFFDMPENDVTITVNWKKNGSSGGGSGSSVTTYSVTVGKTANGTVSVNLKTAAKGSTVTITVTPDKGYVLETLTALDKDGKELKLTEKNGKYTFTMPAGKVEVKATFMDDNTMLNYFVDVKAGDFFYDAVLWAAQKGITTGVNAVEFGPNLSCTRAQIVTFLWRAAGSPEPKSAGSFADVPADSYYAKAVAWAVENGITGGTGDGKFSPDATCTREQAVTFLYRASGSPAVSGGSAFSDVAANAYYTNAVAWAEKNGVTGGIGGGLFGSGNDCTRGQIVTFLYRAYQGK